MLYFSQLKVAFILVMLSSLLFFTIRFKEYSFNRKIKVLLFLYCIALTTKVIDIVFIFHYNLYKVGPYNIYYTLPLFSCDITLAFAIVLTFLNLNNKVGAKKYEFLNKFTTYFLFANGVFVPLLLSGTVPLKDYIQVFNNPTTDFFLLNNGLVHQIYALLTFLFGVTFNVFNKTYRGFFKFFLLSSGVTLVVHIINLIFNAAGFQTNYMYTILHSNDETFQVIYDLFGSNTGNIITKMITAPILENYLGVVLMNVAEVLGIYIWHIIYYKLAKKKAYDNLFYLNLINPNTTFYI